MSRKTNRSAYAKLDELYAQLPALECRGKCGIACGPVPMTVLEAARLPRADPQHAAPRLLAGARCVYLTDQGRCRVYAARPLICRAWGLIKRLACPWGCVPDRWLTDHEFVRLARAVERVCGEHVVTSTAGLIPTPFRFGDIHTERLSPAVADDFADQTRTARVLHGGFVTGVVPGGPGGWLRHDEERNDDE